MQLEFLQLLYQIAKIQNLRIATLYWKLVRMRKYIKCFRNFSLFGSRANSVSSTSSTMSIIMREDIQSETIEKMHSFSMKRGSSTSVENRTPDVYCDFLNNCSSGSEAVNDKNPSNTSTKVCYVQEKFKGTVFWKFTLNSLRCSNPKVFTNFI